MLARIEDTDKTMKVIAELPTFGKWLAGVGVLLILTGLVIVVMLAVDSGNKLNAISDQIDAVKMSSEDLGQEVQDAQVAVKAMEMLMARINENHTIMRDELKSFEERLLEFERQHNVRD